MYHIQHGHRSKRAKLLSKIADFYSPLFKQSPHRGRLAKPRLLWRARRYGVGCVLGSSCEIVVSSCVIPSCHRVTHVPRLSNPATMLKVVYHGISVYP